jgi:hypothetical protein
LRFDPNLTPQNVKLLGDIPRSEVTPADLILLATISWM